MTTQEAEANGYALVRASSFEVGLTKNGNGIRTWFFSQFDSIPPTLEHPLIQEAIRIEELCHNDQ